MGQINWKYILIVAILAALVGGGILGYQYWWAQKGEIEFPEIEIPKKEEVKSFEECVAKGYPILESYPRQCKTPDGTVFTEEMEFLDIDEEITADWKTYFNKTYNYQMKLPKDWGEIAPIDGSFIPNINPDNDYSVFLSAEDGSEQIVVSHFRYTIGRKYSIEYSIDWYISFYDVDKKEYQRNFIRTRYEDIIEIFIPQVNERKAYANRYTYLIEKEKNDCLFEIGFLNKNSITKQILANLRFLD